MLNDVERGVLRHTQKPTASCVLTGVCRDSNRLHGYFPIYGTRKTRTGVPRGNPLDNSKSLPDSEAERALRPRFLTGSAVETRENRERRFPDGSWHVRSRALKFQPYFQSGFP